jgi:outer membrane receptor protein involved in Fe transport
MVTLHLQIAHSRRARHFPALLLCALSSLALAEQVRVTGTVTDPTGAAIISARVTIHSAHKTETVQTDSAGRFEFSDLPDLTGTLDVTAKGFVSVTQEWSLSSTSAALALMLHPLGEAERVVVSASRSELKLSEVPGSAVLLSQTDVEANPALTTDDLLRQVPGFSLFRRSSSRVANPTTQGVSLRGLGASGPSRALVLEDGIPLVDPFGGWVYWDRIPRSGLAGAEVFRGGSSSLYGSDALGGVVQFLSKVPETPSISLDVSYGTEKTPDTSLWAGTTVARWDFETSADMSRTDGYILLPPSQRGSVDTPANSEHATVGASAGYKLSDRGRIFLNGGYFTESRHNGTVAQKNSTATGFAALGLDTPIGPHDQISARVFGQAQGYDQTFSSVRSTTAPRDTEVLTDFQHVPSQQLGGTVQWNHELRSHTLIAGLDTQETMGASDEQLLLAPRLSIAGGRQRSTGIFGQDIFRIARKWTVIAGARWDNWNNFSGSTVLSPPPVGTPPVIIYPDRSENSISPRLSLLRALSSNLSWSVSGYRAFRAPTLNELYRSFQQGTVFTESNPFLHAEKLTGAETGVRAVGFDSKLESRATFFWADIVDPVSNVTISSGATTIRQRQNLGRTRSLGVELDGIVHLTSSMQVSAGYQFVHAYVVDSSATLVGKNVPEVPRHQFTWEARYWNPRRIMLSVQGRYSGAQYDDDLNTLLLPHYYVMDLFAGRLLGNGFTIYLAGENILNQRYPFTLTPPAPPLTSLAPPILARAGIRYDFPARK